MSVAAPSIYPVAGNFCCVIVDPTAFNAKFDNCVMLGKIFGFLSSVSRA